MACHRTSGIGCSTWNMAGADRSPRTLPTGHTVGRALSGRREVSTSTDVKRRRERSRRRPPRGNTGPVAGSDDVPRPADRRASSGPIGRTPARRDRMFHVEHVRSTDSVWPVHPLTRADTDHRLRRSCDQHSTGGTPSLTTLTTLTRLTRLTGRLRRSAREKRLRVMNVAIVVPQHVHVPRAGRSDRTLGRWMCCGPPTEELRSSCHRAHRVVRVLASPLTPLTPLATQTPRASRRVGLCPE
jgi:hypothetical protein